MSENYAINDMCNMEEGSATNAAQEMDDSSEVDTMSVDSDEEEDGTDEEDEESDMERDLSNTIYRTQERQSMKEREVIEIADPSLIPEEWLAPESPLRPCASFTEPTIYYSSHTCLLSGPHEGNCNILPSLAISTTHSSTTRAPTSTAKKFKALHPLLEAKGKTLDGLIYVLATKLPQNVRHQIFRLLIEGWDAQRPWPIRRHNGFGVSLARRYFGSVLTRALRDEEAEQMSWPKDSVDESHFAIKSLMDGMLMSQSVRRHAFSKWRTVVVGSQIGALDYFKTSEYEVVQGFARALEHFEGRDSSIGEGGKIQVENIEHPAYRRRRELGILKEFTAFFWSNVVVDLRATSFHGRSFSGKGIYKRVQPCPVSHHAHHSQIMHIALNIMVDAIPSKKKISENNHEFIRLCRNVNASCRELNSVVLFLSAASTEMALMMTNPLRYKGWIRNVQRLKIAAGGSMDVKLLLTGPEDDSIASRKEKSKQNLKTKEAWLSDLLMPHTMIEHNFEKDGFGLEELFMEHEHTVTPITSAVGTPSQKKAASAANKESILLKECRTPPNTGTTKNQKIKTTNGVPSARSANSAPDDMTANKEQKVNGTRLGALGENHGRFSDGNIAASQNKKQEVLSAKKALALNNTVRLSSMGGPAAVQKQPKTAETTKTKATDMGKRTFSDKDATVARKKQKT